MMRELERLDEALERYDKLRGSLGLHPDIELFMAAARAYRDLLANGQRVWWCERQKAIVDTDGLQCRVGYNEAEAHPECGWRLLSVYPQGGRECRMMELVTTASG